MTTLILEDVKTSIGILTDNLGFDSELLMFINSAKSNLIQLGVSELDIPVDETTYWPVFANETIAALSKHYMQVKVKQTFDPTASETIAKAMEHSAVKLESGITHEVEEVLDVG